MNCENCKTSISKGEEKMFDSRILCDDCYISAIWPRVRKTYDEYNPAEFMQRLKNTWSIHPQQYH
jgi:hypothetical protein